METIQKIIEDHKNNILGKKNVLGIAIGEKWVKGVNTGEEAIIILVEKKESIENLSKTDIIPPTIDGVITDVVGKCGSVSALADTAKYRPIPGGVSAGHVNKATGTIGGWFLDRDNDLVALSNNHVFVDGGKIGDLAFQPGLFDAAAPTAYAGYDAPYSQYQYFGRLKAFGTIAPRSNLHDSATAKIGHSSMAAMMIKDVGAPIGFKDSLTVGTVVMKRGRTTGLTRGRVIGLHATVVVDYGDGFKAIFNDQIITNNMSSPGDSGSLLLDSSKYIVGLLFAGSSTITIHNYIKYPRDLYGLRLPVATAPMPLPRPVLKKKVVKKASKVGRIIGGR